MDKLKYILFGVVVISIPVLLFPKEISKIAENLPTSSIFGRCTPNMQDNFNSLVLYKEDAVPDGNPTRIKKVTKTMEGSNRLVFDVDYVNDGKTDGYITLGIYPDMSAWAVSYTKTQVGEHTVSVDVGLSSEAGRKEILSNTLRLDMEHYNDNQYLGSIFKKLIPYQKSWCEK